jgi:endonuclease YncB( thermonuclease family)
MRVPKLIYASILAAICLPLDAYTASAQHFLPDCAGTMTVAQAQVRRVERNGALVLRDGRTLLLEGIRFPESGPLSRQALEALRTMVQAGPVNFTAWQPLEDRYGRIRVQGFGRQWFQIALLGQGLARVAISPDREECAPDLYEAEARGRARRLGLWALAAYRVRAPEEMPKEMKDVTGTFQLVEGRVSNVGQADGRLFIDFGSKRILSAVIAQGDRRAFRDFDLDGLPAHRIRIRGIVQDYRGRPEIALSNPFQIEVLD